MPTVRKWRRRGTLGGQGKWETEVGDDSPLRNVEVEGMVENSTNVSTLAGCRGLVQ